MMLSCVFNGFVFLTLWRPGPPPRRAWGVAFGAWGVARVLRLIKLARLLRASKLLQRWQTKLNIDYATVALLRCVIGVIVVTHWSSCIWALQASFADTPLDSWMGTFDYCWSMPNSSLTEPEYACVGPWDMYAASVYFAVMTITSIGYGDIAATPHNAASASRPRLRTSTR